MGNLCVKITSKKGTKKTQSGLKQCKVVFVTGGPGSGKGTQCEKILSDFDVGHVSTGDLIRAEVESGTERATQLKETMEKGELVSLDIVLELLREHLSKNSTKHKGFLVDGFPREIDQATRFEKEVVECLCMVYMDASEEVMKERIMQRAKTSGRTDDNEETIVKRIATFRENNDAIVSHFEEKSKLVKIDCNGSEIDAIYSSVKEALEKAGLPLKGSEEAAAEEPATEETPAEKEEKESAKENGEAAKENGEAAKETGDAVKENGDAAKENGEAAKENGEAAKENGEAIEENGDATKENGDAAATAEETPVPAAE